MNTILLSNWTIIRFIRLILGIFIIIQSIQSQNYLMVLPGIIFTALALFNAGCGSNGCSVPTKNRKNDE